ncbi:DUF2339 domain-containing protein [Flavobacterium sp. SM2513]|uniref:DUF2339 domain-containing protein n=1 Tax=Flavobacterium sp. SM2513 TaxID=3424766 RepID=UPI003D7F4413
MEGVLLFVIFILVLLLFLKSHSRDTKIHEALWTLQKKMDAIQKELAAKPVVSERDTQQADKLYEEIISKPVVDTIHPPIKEFEQESVTEEPVVAVSPSVILPDEVEEATLQPALLPISKPKPVISQKSWLETFKENNPDLEKFIGENLINKLGILILVLGISFFVKYAIAKDWINEPARVGIGVLCGALVMAVAHKLKKNYAAFSSVLVAGAISIFYFTIAIAFHEYQLFSQTVAFSIMTVITVFSVLVSVSYNRQELAVLSLIGGFAVPFMVSTGEGNYVVLFTYIALLNTSILAIAYFKKWKIVSILAFIFTSVLFASWYTRELYANTLPHLGAMLFATAFYFIFSITIVLSNIRNKGVFSLPEYFIMVANTFFFFGIGMGIIHNWGIEFKGLFSLLLAIYNVVYAVVLYRKFGLDKNAIYLLIGLALIFVTLTIPLQFEGNQITLFWAAEAVLLFWLSQKSGIDRFKWGALVVQVLTVISLLMDWIKYEYYDENLQIVFNPLFIAGVFVSASLFMTYWLLKKESDDKKIMFVALPLYRTSVGAVAVLVTYFTGFLEIDYQAFQLLANLASANAFVVVYHFVFVALLLFLLSKLKKSRIQDVVLILSALSIVLYIVTFYSLPNDEIVQNFVGTTTTQYALYFHYIVLGCLIYMGYQLFARASKEPRVAVLNNKIMPWLFVFATVYILSNEMMVHSLVFSKGSIDVTQIQSTLQKSDVETYGIDFEKQYLYEDKLHDIKAQIIKIGYPIVWGLFSFVFLIIGIKKQWKNLRIISLSLLGLTIVKLFVYDIKNVSETGKIVAFILLGVLILIISFVYQKVKKLVVDDAPKTSTDEEIK